MKAKKKHKDNNLKIIAVVIAVLALVFFGANCVQTNPQPLAITGAGTNGATSGGSSGGGGGGPSANDQTPDDGSGTPPSVPNFGGWSFPSMPNFDWSFPSFSGFSGSGSEPAAGSPESGGPISADPCDLNPNQIGCGTTPSSSPPGTSLPESGFNFFGFTMPTFDFSWFASPPLLPATDDGAAAPQPEQPAAPATPDFNVRACTGTNYGLPMSVVHSATGDRYTSFECSGSRDCIDNPPGGYTGRPTSLYCCDGECYN